MSKTQTHRSLQSEHLTRLLVSQRIWGFLEGTQAYADLRAVGDGDATEVSKSSREHPDDLSLVGKVVTAPVTRKDRRFYIDVTAGEAESLRRYVEAMREGAADNTWDADGRADLFAANSLLEQMRKAGL